MNIEIPGSKTETVKDKVCKGVTINPRTIVLSRTGEYQGYVRSRIANFPEGKDCFDAYDEHGRFIITRYIKQEAVEDVHKFSQDQSSYERL